MKPWFGIALRKAKQINITTPFDAAVFAAKAPALIRAIRTNADFYALPSELAKLGVILEYVKPFPGSRISGATFEVNGRPGIAITGLGKRLDKIIFTLLHEAAHVANGDWQHGGFLGHEDGNIIGGATNDAETRADALASNWAFPNGLSRNDLDTLGINGIAAKEGIDISVVVGRLQNDRVIPWRTIHAKGLKMLTETELMAWA